MQYSALYACRQAQYLAVGFRALKKQSNLRHTVLTALLKTNEVPVPVLVAK